MPPFTTNKKLQPAQPKKWGYKERANRAFKVKHGLTYSGQKPGQRVSWGEALKDVDQPSFEEILRMSQDDAKSFLVKQGVLPRDEHAATFKCWKRNSDILAKSGFRCSGGKACPSLCRMTLPQLAYTPL